MKNSSTKSVSCITAFAASYALAQACSGRENHAALVEVRAMRRVGSHFVVITWRDRFTHQGGLLGRIPAEQAPPVVARVFRQLREWRARCEQTPALAMAAGGAR